MIGKTLGNYQLIEQIGEGGMAEVYKAYESGVDRHVAVKIMLPHLARDADFRARFDREARSIAMLEHIHILPIYAYGEEDGMLYLSMRFMPYGSLEDYIEKDGPLPMEEISRILLELAAALDYAHERGVLHRDVKPENVLMDYNKNTFLSDFGLARMLERSVNLTGNFLAGTPAYMSPEQCFGNEDIDGRADQYALAIVLFQMVTGTLPFEHENPLKMIQMHIRSQPPSPRELRPDLNEIAEAVIMRALAKEPDERYETCTEFAEAFDKGALSAGLRITKSARMPSQLRARIDGVLGSLQFDSDDDDSSEQEKKDDTKK